MGYVPGIDVSYWQAAIDWRKVRGDGIRFVFVKATEGEKNVDPTFDDNWMGARAAGILRGACHFFHPSMDPARQADHFVLVLRGQGDEGELPPVLDLEVTDNQSNPTILSNVKTWLERVQEALGRRVIIYSNPSFLTYNFSIPGGGPPQWARECLLWIANYVQPQPQLPSGWPEWAFWQHSEAGQVNGIGTSVDLDWFNGSVEDLYQLAGTHPPGLATYRVRAGDTLQSIAERHGVTLPELLAANPQLVQPHTDLNIPAAGDQASEPVPSVRGAARAFGGEAGEAPAATRTYTVKSGDTLPGIALKYATTYGVIAQLNGIAPPYLIVPGQVLKIP